MFTLAHFSDPHLGPLPKPRVSELLGKRFFGYLSWVRRRRAIHRPEILTALATDLASQAPDHMAITGDLTNISLPGEFEQVRTWLEALGPPDRITVVPGNHDAYVPIAWDRSIGLWADYFASEGEDRDFPILRRRGEIALVGLNTAVPSPIAFASGRLGSGQLDRLEAMLGRLGKDGAFRIVLLHHPPHEGGASWRKGLRDAAALRSVIARAGAELVLHGHNHEFASAQLAAGTGLARVFGVPSASASRAGKKPQSHYHLYGIERADDGWRVTVTVRGLDPHGLKFAETGTETLKL